VTDIPLVDLAWQHQQVAAEIDAGFASVIARGAFVGGAEVSVFEQAFAEASGVPHCIGVANGTDAIELALRALRLPPRSGVALPVNTFMATAEAVLRAGLAPVLVDVDETHGLLDPERLAELAPRCRAVVPVHLHGQLAPMREILAVAGSHGLVVVEDAAQAQLARQHGRAAGAWGHAAATSFYPGKNLGAYGDAGAVLTKDDELQVRLRSLRAHGTDASGGRYAHPELGFNSRLDTLQSVVLLAKLARLEHWNALRREAAARYDALLQDVQSVALPQTAPGNLHIWHIYAVRVQQRDLVLRTLNARGIGAGAHYPVPLNEQGALQGEPGAHGSYPVGGRACRETLSLPLFPGITEDQQVRVVEALVASLAAGRAGSEPGPVAARGSPGPTDETVQDEVLVHPRAMCEGQVGARTRVWANAHVMAGARVGDDCNIGEGVFVESGVRLGDRVTVKNGVLLWDGVAVEDDVFLGPAVVFTNDVRPRSRQPAAVVPTTVRTGASVGAGAVIVCGTVLGKHCMVAAGAVVTSDVPAHALVVGVPARRRGWACACGAALGAD
jgi:dTDP-4-amino-4,6-dideoxygalactose transaminase/acetyltransferase-like isoleucine patch superfamily enzyme